MKINIRDLAREARSVPVLRRAMEATDPARRIQRLLRAEIVDADLYARQLGIESMTEQHAVKHYVHEGYRDGLTLNALIDNLTLKNEMPPSRRPRIYEYIAAGDWSRRVSPVWNAAAYLAAHPDSAAHPGGPVGHLWSAIRAGRSDLRHVALSGRDLPWTEAYGMIADAIAEWEYDKRATELRRPTLGEDHKTRILTAALPDRPGPEPLVSIVMATWNRAGSMREAVDSVLAQSWRAWELIIADDGSWDSTPEIARLLESRDARIRYLPLEHRGVSAARNAALAAARGDYIAFLDSDNTWEPRFLSKTVRTMQAHGHRAAFATVELIAGTHRMYWDKEPTRGSLELSNSVDLNTLVVRADVLDEVGDFDTGLRRAVDYDLILRIARTHRIAHVPVIGAIYDNDEAHERISTLEPLGWNTLVRLKNALPEPSPESPGTAARAHILAIVQRRDKHVDTEVRAILAAAEELQARVTFAFVGPTRSEWTAGIMARLGRDDVRSLFFSRSDPFAYVVDRAAQWGNGAVTAIVDCSYRIATSDLVDMVERVESSEHLAVMPLAVGPGGVVEEAGAYLDRRGDTPRPLLRGLASEDATVLGDIVEVPLLSGGTVVLATRDFEAAGRMDPLLYNEFDLTSLALRLRALFPDYRFELSTALLWRRAGKQTVFTRTDPVGNAAVITQHTRDAVPVAADRYYEPAQLGLGGWMRAEYPHTDIPLVYSTTAREAARLRWSIKIASPSSSAGETWGDTHFAASLAAALRELGQHVGIDRREAHDRPLAHVDDVIVTIRGLDAYIPPRTATSILWIISHPELVTKQEVLAYDAVFAASAPWARKMSQAWGVDIQPLLQCTNADRFHPDRPGASEHGDEILFVGNSRGVPRPVVTIPIANGIDVHVYGDDWDRFIGRENVRGSFIPNDELAARYQKALVVLNDHWEDMREEGFISNRLFDVVAAGGRVLSDRVAGIEEIFGGAVATYDDAADLLQALRDDIDGLFPDEQTLAELSERVRAEHTFTQRAASLLDAARRIRHAAGALD